MVVTTPRVVRPHNISSRKLMESCVPDGVGRNSCFLECLSSSYTLLNSYKDNARSGSREAHCRGNLYLFSTDRESVAHLTRFRNSMGFSTARLGMPGTVCARRVQLHSSVSSVMNSALEDLACSLGTSEAWVPTGLEVFEYEGDAWYSRRSAVGKQRKIVLDAMSALGSPVCVLNADAVNEAKLKSAEPSAALFASVSHAPLCSGIFGTLSFHQLVDNHPERTEYGKEREQWAPQKAEEDVLCCASTAHSVMAGRMRYTAMGTRVAVAGPTTGPSLYSLARMLASAGIVGASLREKGEGWVPFVCMGHMCYVRPDQATESALMARACSKAMRSSLSAHGNETDGVVVGTSSGVLINDVETGHNTKMSLNAYYHTVPFLLHDMPPRTLISFAHSSQAVGTPATSGNPAIVQCYASKPLVRTKLVQRIVDELAKPGRLATLPGFDVCVCYANMPDNYEDCFMLSKAAADRGMFMYEATSRHSLSSAEAHVAVGAELTTKTHPWWKADVRGVVTSTKTDVHGS